MPELTRTYYARNHSNFSDEQAAIFGPVLDEMSQKGTLLAEEVVEAARPETSVLHPFFTFNDQLAAEKWRKIEARQLINGYRVVVSFNSGEERLVPSMVSVPIKTGEDIPRNGRNQVRAYVPLERIVDNPETQRLMLREALLKMRALQQRYQLLLSFSEEHRRIIAPVFQAVDEAQTELDRLEQEE